MERNLLLGSLALGLLGWLAGFVLSRAAPAATRASRPGLAIGIIVIIVVAVKAAAARVMWPAAYPWELGAALGGVAAWLGAWALDRVDRAGAGLARGTVTAAPMFLAVAVSAGAAVWLRSSLVEILLGIGFGWLVVTLAVNADALAQPPADGFGRMAVPLPALGFALTLPVAVALGTFRDAAAQTTTWSTALIVLALGAPLCLVLVGAAGNARRDAGSSSTNSSIIAILAASIVFGGLAALVGIRLLGQPRFAMAAGVGLLTSLIVWWLCAETAGEPTRDAASGLPTGAHVLAALAALGGVVAAFYLLIGYGVALAMVAAWLPAIVAVVKSDGTPRQDKAAIRTSLLLVLGVVILLYRVFVQRFDADLTGTTLTDHFAIFTFIGGLFVPGLLGRVLSQPTAGTGRLIFRLVVVYALMALVPAAVLGLWGSRAAIGLIAGFAASTVIYADAPAAQAVAAGISLLLAQWGHHAISISTLTRDDRVKIVVALAIGIAILIVVADVRARSVGRPLDVDPTGRETKGAQS